MAAAQALLPQGAPIAFIHRYITRPADAGGENHVSLGSDMFSLLRERGLFSLSWESHGFSYGIGREIDLWMEAGLTVVVNGSRAYLAQALRRYPDLLPVLVCVPAHILRMRLQDRGRECGEDLGRRLKRAALKVPPVPGLVRIDNSGLLSTAANDLAALLLAAAAYSHGRESHQSSQQEVQEHAQ